MVSNVSIKIWSPLPLVTVVSPVPIIRGRPSWSVVIDPEIPATTPRDPVIPTLLINCEPVRVATMPLLMDKAVPPPPCRPVPAAVAAILTSKIPKWEMKDDIPVLIENQESDAPITTIPISVTMGRIGDFIIVDPNLDEWECLDARITITTNSDGNIVALQKGGDDGFSFDQLVKCSETSIAVGKEIREIVKQATGANK